MSRLDPIPLPVPLAAPASPSSSLGLEELWRGRWIIALVALTVIGLGGYYAYHVAPLVYRTHAVLMLTPGDRQIIDIGQVVPAIGQDERMLNTQAAVLRSRTLARRVVEQLWLHADPEFNPALHDDRPPGLKDRLRSRLTDLGIMPEPIPRSNRADAHIDRAVTRLTQKIDVTAQPESLILTVSIGTRNAEKSAEIVNTLAELYVAEQVAARQSATDRASHLLTEKVIGLKSDLEEAEALARAARSERDLVAPEVLKALERRHAALGVIIDAGDASDDVIAERDALSRDINAAATDQVTVRQLERDAAATRLLYETFLARLKETALSDGFHEPDARIVSQAIVPLYPAEPKRKLILALSVIMGLGAGGLAALGRDAARVRVETVEALGALTGLPVLAAVAEAPARRDPLDFGLRQPGGLLARQIRDVRGALMLRAGGRPPHVIAVTGAIRGEGASTLALLLADTLAQWDRSVLLIEADAMRPSLLARYDEPERHGILSVLAGLVPLDTALWEPPGTSIQALPAEPVNATGADMFSAERLGPFLQAMRGRFDHVVIDAPPILDGAEARAATALADTTLVAVSAKGATRAQVRRAGRALADFGVPIAGTVLTRANPARLRMADRAA